MIYCKTFISLLTGISARNFFLSKSRIDFFIFATFCAHDISCSRLPCSFIKRNLQDTIYLRLTTCFYIQQNKFFLYLLLLVNYVLFLSPPINTNMLKTLRIIAIFLPFDLLEITAPESILVRFEMSHFDGSLKSEMIKKVTA